MSFTLNPNVKNQLHAVPMNDRASALTFAAPANTAAPVPVAQPAPKKTLG